MTRVSSLTTEGPAAPATISAAEARRIFLNAQGVARSRPGRRVRDAHLGDYLRRQGVLQLDTVNVLARAHYLPVYSRLGAYDTAAADAYLWGAADGHSAHTFEHWGHEASVMPLDMLPLMHHRMVGNSTWKARVRDRLEAERPGLIEEVRAFVEASGPVQGRDVEHLSPRQTKKGPWWDTSHVKDALDLLFITGELASSRGANFSRTYDSTQRAWGLPPASRADWAIPRDDARQALFDRGLSASGIGTPRDIADHFRLVSPAGTKPNETALWAASAVERGIAEWVTVEGWGEPALLAVAGPSADATWRQAAADPGRATGAALLSPFDPVAWFRPRLERMFGMEYRIEIYTPAPKRIYGYYCLPFLLGDQIVGRVDLKADRKAGALRAEATWREERAVRGARRRSDAEIAAALAAELGVMAGWLGLGRVEAAARGNLAAALLAEPGVSPVA